MTIAPTSFLKLGSQLGFSNPSSLRNLNAEGWNVVRKQRWNRAVLWATTDGLANADCLEVSAADLLNMASIKGVNAQNCKCAPQAFKCLFGPASKNG